MLISLQEADNYVRQHLAIRNEQAQQHDPATLQTVAAQNFFSSPEISFVFERAAVENLLQQSNANGLRFYLGAEPESGFPTLLIVPCQTDSNGNVANISSDTAAFAEQHPRRLGTSQSPDSFTMLNDDIVDAELE